MRRPVPARYSDVPGFRAFASPSTTAHRAIRARGEDIRGKLGSPWSPNVASWLLEKGMVLRYHWACRVPRFGPPPQEPEPAMSPSFPIRPYGQIMVQRRRRTRLPAEERIQRGITETNADQAPKTGYDQRFVRRFTHKPLVCAENTQNRAVATIVAIKVLAENTEINW